MEDHYEDEVDQNQHYVQPPPPPLGRPHAYHRNGRAAQPPQVRDHEHLPKLKLIMQLLICHVLPVSLVSL